MFDWLPLLIVAAILLMVILYSVYPYYHSRSGTAVAAVGKTLLWLAVMGSTGYVVFDKTNIPNAGWFWTSMLVIWLVTFIGFILYATAQYYVAGVKDERSAGARKTPFSFVKWLNYLLALIGALVVLGLLTGSIDWSVAGRFLALIGGASFFTAISRKFQSQRAGGEGETPDLPMGGVLFIRAFRTEKEPFWSGWNYQAPLPVLQEHENAVVVSFTFEEFLQDALEACIGPLVGLGNPRDTIPSGKAQMVYGEDDVWQQSVLRLLAGSKAVLMKVGQSDNLRWELEQIRQSDALRKFFILTEPLQSQAPRRFNRMMCRLLGIKLSRADWPSFVQSMQALGYSLPSDDPGPGSVIGFDGTGVGKLYCRGANEPDDYASVIAVHISHVNAQTR